MTARAVRHWYVYVLMCSDGSFYVGVTKDIKTCLDRHNAGKDRHTRKRAPCLMRFAERHPTRRSAKIGQSRISKLTPAEIKALISGCPIQ